MNEGRRQVILRALGTAFRELEGDNALIHRPVRKLDLWWNRVQSRKPGQKINSDYMSVPEVSRLIQLPTEALQVEYDLTAVKHREVNLPELILKDGIEIGTYSWRGKEAPVFVPVGKKHRDELCLGRGVIASSKLTYKGLQEEIVPFDIDEGLRTPKHHVINVLQIGSTHLQPFMLRMAKPPSMWRENICPDKDV